MSHGFNHQLNSENIAEILHKNLGFKIVDDEPTLGKMAKIDPREAFTLSLVHGSPYLINPVGFSLKGRMEVFIHRGVFQNNKYIYTPGLFGRKLDLSICEGDSPYYIWKKYPQIFRGEKYVLFKEIERGKLSNIEKQTYDSLVSKGYNPADFMLFKIMEQESNLEPFFEYLCCKLFNASGYLTEDQVPWFQQSYKGLTGGIPDVGAYKIPLLKKLQEKRLLSHGRVIQELSTIFIWPENSTGEIRGASYELVLGEVKISKSQKLQALQQLERYAAAQLCGRVYAVLHDESSLLKDCFGLVSINDDYVIEVQEPKKKLGADKKLQENDELWLTNYAKFYLLANISFEKVSHFIDERRRALGKNQKEHYKSYDLVESVVTCPTTDLLDFLENEIESVSGDD